MPVVAAGLIIDLNAEDEGTTAIGFRRALAVLFRQSSPGVAAPGRLGADHLAVSASSSDMTYTVSGGGIVLVRSSTGGAYLVGVPAATVVPAAIGDSVNPRYDRIYAKQPDPVLDGAGVDVGFIIDVVSGVPAGSPNVPALPAGAYELARKLVPAGATNTAAGGAFTNVAPTTGLNLGVGGVQATRDAADLVVSDTQPPYADDRLWVK